MLQIMLIIVEKNEIDLSRNDGFFGDGLSGLSFCSRQKARCDLLDLPVLNAQIMGRQRDRVTTGYMCNSNAKEIKILFCEQIGRSPNTSYAKCRMGLREGKMEMAGNSFSSRPIFVS